MIFIKKITLIGLSALVLSGGAMDEYRKADDACGPNPSMPFRPDLTRSELDNSLQAYFDILKEEPIDFLECRAAFQDRLVSYILGLEYVLGKRVGKDYVKAV